MLLFDTLKSEQTIDNHGITNHKIGLTAIVGAGLVPALFPSGEMKYLNRKECPAPYLFLNPK
jgi:hypothetical protein